MCSSLLVIVFNTLYAIIYNVCFKINANRYILPILVFNLEYLCLKRHERVNLKPGSQIDILCKKKSQ